MYSIMILCFSFCCTSMYDGGNRYRNRWRIHRAHAPTQRPLPPPLPLPPHVLIATGIAPERLKFANRALVLSLSGPQAITPTAHDPLCAPSAKPRTSRACTRSSSRGRSAAGGRSAPAPRTSAVEQCMSGPARAIWTYSQKGQPASTSTPMAGGAVVVVETEWGESDVDQSEYGFVTTQLRDSGRSDEGCGCGCVSYTHPRYSRPPSSSTPALNHDTFGSPTAGPACTMSAACWNLENAGQGTQQRVARAR